MQKEEGTDLLDIYSDNGTSANKGVILNADVAQHLGACTNPDAVSNLGVPIESISLACIMTSFVTCCHDIICHVLS